ncbi:PAS domain-containing protein [Novosphingobium aquimarinum]|uniref:PAS domain-containing protein n=1 Tax=Novosphingobium aquimarinum TaxID=2682494 RepID=UPI0012EC71EB|nr:PAS domain-containing protein [Novosphingobium aquimarinum]
MDEALIVCNQEMTVIFLNRVARAVVQFNTSDIVGNDLFDALPSLADNPVEEMIRRTLVAREPGSADIASPFSDKTWLRFQSIPLDGHVVLKFRDITEEVHRHHFEDVKKALIQAMSAHGEIGYLRLSARGTIDRIGRQFCSMLEFPMARLEGVLLGELVAEEDEPRFRETFEMVLRGNGPRRMQIGFRTNSGELLNCTLAIVPLSGAYRPEGAVCLLTKANGHVADRPSAIIDARFHADRRDSA